MLIVNPRDVTTAEARHNGKTNDISYIQNDNPQMERTVRSSIIPYVNRTNAKAR